MLNTYYTENLTGLKDAIIDSVEQISDVRHIYLHMEQRIHKCPNCGKYTSRVHDYRMQKIKDVPSFGLKTILHVRKRRHVCPCCGKRFYEKIDFLPKYHRITNRLWGYVLGCLSDTVSLKSIAKEVALSETSIARMIDRTSFTLKTLPEAIAIDEFKGNAEGEKFQCILTNPKKHKVLDILPSRKAENLYEYFSTFETRREVKYVVMDMSPLFRSVVKNTFPNAEIIADKYHVVRQVSWAFENVRKKEQKRFSDYRRKYFKRSRTLLLKDKSKLSRDELEQVALMLETSKPLALAYYLKNEFYDVMHAKDIYEAKKKLGDWFLKAQTANLPEFQNCINTFTNWEKEILNIFRYSLSNGYTEGCNNKIKVLKRVSYGVKNFSRFRKRILLSMSKEG